MKMVGRFALLVSILALVCAQGFAGGGAEGKGEQKLVILGSHINPGAPENRAMNWMKEEFEKRGGAFRGEVYESSTIGNEQELFEQTQRVQAHVTIGGSAIQDRYARRYTVTTIPFLLEDDKVLGLVFSGKIGDAMRKAYEEYNVVIAGYSLRGNRQLTSNRPVRVPADLVGMKIRLPENRVWMDVWSALGALPTPVASAEIFNALQTGVVEAQENPISSNHQRASWEVQKYTNMTNHVYDYFIWQVPKNWTEALPADQRKIFDGVVQDGIQRSTDITLEMESEFRADMIRRGMVYIDDVNFKALQTAAMPTIERVLSQELEPWVKEELQRILASKR